MKNKILVVDDEADILHIWQWILSRAGYDVITASGGKEAIALAKSQRPDLIILDITMPGMNGVETTDVLMDTRQTRNIPIIYLSNLVHEDEAEHGYVLGSKIGKVRFVPKSSSPEEILSIIQEYTSK